MIVGIGVDIVSVKRIEKACEKEAFINRILTPEEKFKDPYHFAGIWAAKEAVSKALGVGIGSLSFQDISIINDKFGKPEIKLSFTGQEFLCKIGGENIFVSISHEKEYAIAQVIIEGGK